MVGCAFSPDGTQLATTGFDETVRIWDPHTGDTLHTLTGHAEGMYGCAFSPDGILLATTGDDQTVKIWGNRS